MCFVFVFMFMESICWLISKLEGVCYQNSNFSNLKFWEFKGPRSVPPPGWEVQMGQVGDEFAKFRKYMLANSSPKYLSRFSAFIEGVGGA